MVKILFAASEAVPFVKTGGLADVVGSLPKYLDKDEYDVRVIMPKYAFMDEHFKKMLHFKSRFYVNLGWRKQYVGLLEAQYEGITYYFIDNEFYFSGNQPYNNIYEDIEKFAFFSKAVVEILPILGFMPDIIHCHDWQTGLIPVYLQSHYFDSSFYHGIKTIYTIHNMKFQGRFILKATQDITGLPDELFTPDKLESYGEANFLKGGVVFSDIVTTVSPTYAYEITTQDGGEGLDGLMQSRSADLYGIVNGIDYEKYNPKTDSHMAKHFGASDLSLGKKANKQFLQKNTHLPENENVFMIGMVSRMTDQKGFDLVLYILEELLYKENIQLVILGTGEEKYERALHQFAQKYPKKLYVSTEYSEDMAHRIYASVDAFLMPSLFEPCGLSQLMSMRYGTIPMVRETGGLKDTVEPYNEYEDTGTGFSFSNYNAHEMLDMIHYALRVYRDTPLKWKNMALRCMEQDYSWNSSAREYEALYTKLLS